MTVWEGTWVWRVGMNSRHGFAFQADKPSRIGRLCTHFHRTERTAQLCGEQIAKRMNAEFVA